MLLVESLRIMNNFQTQFKYIQGKLGKKCTKKFILLKKNGLKTFKQISWILSGTNSIIDRFLEDLK